MCASARSDGGRGDERRGEGVTEGERGERGGRVREGKKKGGGGQRGSRCHTSDGGCVCVSGVCVCLWK